jgi:predicted enzyme related to lactoylglutathione lyase
MISNELIEIILYVQDMKRMTSFYHEVFNLPISYPVGVSDYSKESWVTFGTGTCALALHSGGKGRIGADTPMIVFGVKDIHFIRSTLVNRGVTLDDVFQAAPGVLVCHGRDPEGNPIALEEHLGSSE